MIKLLKNASVLLPDFSIEKRDILIKEHLIHDVLPFGSSPDITPDIILDLDGYLVFPGLINSHDHLIDTCWKAPLNTSFDNWYEYSEELKHTSEYEMMRRLSITDLYSIGMYKNIVSGTTTVVDHFPCEVSSTFYNNPLVSLLENFCFSHSICPSKREWNSDLSEQFQKTLGVLPFLVHALEGKDKEFQQDILTLDRLGVLASNTVLAGCNYASDNDFETIKNKNSAIIWLPTSSQNKLAKQLDIGKILNLGIRFVIGTDSSITGSQNILQELRFAYEFSKQHLNSELTAQQLVKTVTIDAANIWKIAKQTGTIEPQKNADLIVFKEKKDAGNEFEQLINLQVNDFALVMHKGLLVYSDDKFRIMASSKFSSYSVVKVDGVSKVIFGQPKELLERIGHKLAMPISFPFFPINIDDFSLD